MKEKIVRYLKSLSARLLLLTFIWVSFISVLVGYTMLLNWQLEASSAATKTITDMRYHTFRVVILSQPMYSTETFDAEVKTINESYALLKKGDPWLPLMLPPGEKIQEGLETVSIEWFDRLLPILCAAREHKEGVNIDATEKLVASLSALTEKVEEDRTYFLWQLRYLQISLIIMAICSLFVIMFLLLRWVVRPVDRLGEAIHRLSSGDLSARVDYCGEDEIGQIAQGFNLMADRLEDSYDNLEQKVAEKTASVQEKNSYLAQLYEMTAFFAQQRSQEEIIEGFVSRIIRHSNADACTVHIIDESSGLMQLDAADGISGDLLYQLSRFKKDEDVARNVLEKSYPVCLHLKESDEPLSQSLCAAGFNVVYSFQIRSTTGDIGVYSLYFKSGPRLTTQLVRLLKNFASHFGIAIQNARLNERDSQFAVVQERQLLAQGLHDSIAQALSFLNLQVQFLMEAIERNDNALRDDSLASIRKGVQECYEDVRELLLNFRERLHKEDFIEGVQTVIKRFEGQAHVQTKLKVVDKGIGLTPRQKLQVIFIIQEALSNVRKHAQAQSVLITIDNREDLRVNILDDGVGLDEEVVETRKGQHVGLSIMSERAKRIGASLSVSRAGPEGGTLVSLFLGKDARH